MIIPKYVIIHWYLLLGYTQDDDLQKLEHQHTELPQTPSKVPGQVSHMCFCDVLPSAAEWIQYEPTKPSRNFSRLPPRVP